MAEEEKPRGTERQRKVYKHETSRKERGEGDGERRAPASEPAPAEQINREEGKGGGDAKRGGHAAERMAMHDRHHEERRALMAAHLREHKAMDADHEAQHKGVSDHAALVALHRHHEGAKHDLHQKHATEMHAQRTAHHGERMALHHKHETEMLAEPNAAGAEGKEAA